MAAKRSGYSDPSSWDACLRFPCVFRVRRYTRFIGESAMRKTLPGVLLFVLVARPIAAQPPAPVTIEDLLQRAAVYVADFDKRFANIVAEERYEQTLMRTDPRFRQRVQRTLVSDVLPKARYNVGPERNVNVPVLALMVLRAPNLPRFAFGHASR